MRLKNIVLGLHKSTVKRKKKILIVPIICDKKKLLTPPRIIQKRTKPSCETMYELRLGQEDTGQFLPLFFVAVLSRNWGVQGRSSKHKKMDLRKWNSCIDCMLEIVDYVPKRQSRSLRMPMDLHGKIPLARVYVYKGVHVLGMVDISHKLTAAAGAQQQPTL